MFTQSTPGTYTFSPAQSGTYQISMRGGSNGTWATGAVSLSATSQGTPGVSGFDRYQMRVNSRSCVNGSSFTLTEDGEATVQFRVIDRAGNAGTPTAVQTLLRDSAPLAQPSSSFRNSYTPASWTNQSVFKDIPAGPAGVSDHNRIEYRVNGGSWNQAAVNETLV